MDPFTIYALVIGGVFAALFILNTIRLSPILLRSRFAKQIFRHIVWPVLIPRTRLTPPITRGDAIVQSFYWGGTIVANVFRVQNLPQAASRAGSLTILHLVPLMAGSRLSFAADMIGLSLRTYQYLHNTLGVMLTAQLLSHIALLLKCGRVRILESRDRFGVIAGGSLLTVVAVAIPFLRRLIYEIFLWIHGYLPAVALFGIWWHIEAKRYIDRILLMTCMAVFLGFDIIRFVKLLYWNSTRKQILSRAVATERNGAVLLRITLARPWRIQPGDHVYLRCLSLSPRSVLESHPFSITWWERDSYDTDRTSTVYILANPQFGFTRRLFHRSNHNRPLKMLIDGPYGNSIKTARFTTILLFASGIGVAALMPFIKAAISRQPEPSDSVRRVSLIWEIERESDEGWVTIWMNRMLEADESKMLHFSLYVTERDKPAGSPIDFGKRGKGLYGKCCVPRVMSLEMDRRIGPTLVLVAAAARMRDQLREEMPKYINRDVHLELLDFDPTEEREGFWGRHAQKIDYEGAVNYD